MAEISEGIAPQRSKIPDSPPYIFRVHNTPEKSKRSGPGKSKIRGSPGKSKIRGGPGKKNKRGTGVKVLKKQAVDENVEKNKKKKKKKKKLSRSEKNDKRNRMPQKLFWDDEALIESKLSRSKSSRTQSKRQRGNNVAIYAENDEKFVVSEYYQKIFAKKSLYFEQTFTSDVVWKESIDKQIDLTDVNADNFKKVSRFLRIRHISLRLINIIDMSILADRFICGDMIEFCKRYLKKKISTKNVLQIWSIPYDQLEPYHSNIVEEEAARFARELKVRELLETVHYRGVDARVMHSYFIGLKHHDEEVKVARAILKWMKNNLRTNSPDCCISIPYQCEYLLESVVDWSEVALMELDRLLEKNQYLFNDYLPGLFKCLQNLKSILENYGGSDGPNSESLARFKYVRRTISDTTLNEDEKEAIDRLMQYTRTTSD